MKSQKIVAGIDFGTSNSAIAIASAKSDVNFVKIHGEDTIPTTIFVELEGDLRGKTFFGNEAINKAYGKILQPDGSFKQVDRSLGRLLRGLKNLLGSSTLHEQLRIQDDVGYNHCFMFSELIKLILEMLKNNAETSCQNTIEDVVLGRPVRFVDTDDARDQEAENQLRDIAKKTRFKNIEFLFEPIAAALSFEAQIQSETLAAVVDVGGGTTDVTIIRLNPKRHKMIDRSSDILANAGVHVGGTEFDRAISMAKVAPEFGLDIKYNSNYMPREFLTNLSTWQQLNRLYTKRTLKTVEDLLEKSNPIDEVKLSRLLYTVEMQEAHLVLGAVEDAKIALSDSEKTLIDFNNILTYEKEPLQIGLDRHELEGTILNFQFEKIDQAIKNAIQMSGVSNTQIESVFMTGGPSAMPQILSCVQQNFPNAEIIKGNRLSAVGEGLGIAAKNCFL